MDVIIKVGDAILDVDSETSFQLHRENPVFSGKLRIERKYTYDLSVPDTHHNSEILGWGNNIPLMDMRRKQSCEVTTDGCLFAGSVVVLEWSGGRYSLEFTVNTGGEGYFDSQSIRIWNQKTPKFQPEGSLLNDIGYGFGWANYDNGAHPDGSFAYSTSPTCCPAASIGSMLVDFIEYSGWGGITTLNVNGVRWNDASLITAGISPMCLCMIMASANSSTNDTVTVTNFTGVGGGTVSTGSGAPLSDLGLSYEWRMYRRGLFNSQVQVWGFKATRPVHVQFPSRNNPIVIVAGHKGYEFFGCTRPEPYDTSDPDWRALEIDLEPGQHFTLVHQSEWAQHLIGPNKWRRDAYETNITSLTFSVRMAAGTIATNQQCSTDLLPDMTISELFELYASLIGATYSINPATGVVEFRTFDYLLQQITAGNLTDLTAKVVSTRRVVGHLDGWARHNYIKGKNSYQMTSDDDEVHIDLPVVADGLEDSRVFREIGFNFGYNHFYDLYHPDVTTNDNGETEIKGSYTLYWHEPGNSAQRPQHMNYLYNELGAYSALARFTAYAVVMEFDVLLDLPTFNSLDAFVMHGQTWIVMDATWADGVATIKAAGYNPADLA